MTQDHPDFKNPIIAAQTFDFPFISDPYQGHTMPPGREFLGEKNYISMEEMIAEMKNSKKKIILNIGDSSTSGWDSNIVTQNRELHVKGLPLLPAFFQYQTYSDYLRHLVGDEYIVINAGVPAHTSLQGSRRIKLLLDRFQKENIPIHWVTIYYGNNDSVWDHNRQDKEWVGKKGSLSFDKIFKFFKKEEDSVITRVMPEDYKTHIKEIVQTCKNYGATPIVIEPVTPIYWKPGTRVLNEDLERKNYPGSNKVYQLLDEARSLWSHAVGHHSYSELKRAALEEVKEKDFVVPRIKRSHLSALRSLVQELNIPFLHVKLDKTNDDIRQFIDYCHPIGEANQSIANKIADVISGKNTGKEYFSEEHKPSVVSSEPAVMPELPTDHYTLY